MRVITYARGSTLDQEQLGESLPNQERAFTRWLERNGCDSPQALAIESGMLCLKLCVAWGS